MSTESDLPTVVERVETPVDAPRGEVGNVDEELALARLSKGLGGGSVSAPTVGRYVLLERLGEGGMGLVMRAYDPRMRREVAIKLLRPAQGPSATDRARLAQEAQALAQLQHPNIVEVYDAEETERGVCIVMEYVPGQSLRQWVRQGKTLTEILDIAIQVAAGLSEAHSHGLIHRDVKPDNILIGDDGRARVADFGLARAVGTLGGLEGSGESSSGSRLSSDSNLTEAGAILGTPAYMAPEQHRGEPADARADQYGLCLTLWEALYGERPFRGRRHELLPAKEDGAPPRPSNEVPRWLHAVVARGLHPDPEHRWPSCAALLSSLRQGASQVRRRRLGMGVAISVALAAAGYGWHQSDRAQRSAQCVDNARAVAERTPADSVREAWLRQWSDASAQACIDATVYRTLSAKTHTKIDQCLTELHAEFEGLMSARGSSERPEDPSRCVDRIASPDAFAIPSASPHPAAVGIYLEVARARGLTRGGQPRQGRELAARALQSATELDAAHVVAAARVELGRSLAAMGRLDEAEPMLRDGFNGAQGDLVLAAAAAVELLGLVGQDPQRDHQREAWAAVAEMFVRRAAVQSGPIGRRFDVVRDAAPNPE